MTGKQWVVLGLLAVGVVAVFALVAVVVVAPTSIGFSPGSAPGSALGTAGIRTEFENAGFLFQSNSSSPSRAVGESKDRDQVVELVGQPDKWSTLTVASTLAEDSGKRSVQIQSMQMVLRKAVPEWDSASWLTTNVPVAVERGSVETTHGNARITLKTVRPPGIITLFLIVQRQ